MCCLQDEDSEPLNAKVSIKELRLLRTDASFR